jgi:cyclopropane fatty-acyl-phospholipid synthase-like methyltransferase
MSGWGRLTFWIAYLFGRTPWDTNITPPELVATIEGPERLPLGSALDLGCGTGTNVIYLAQHGWDAVGVDFVKRAIRRARAKARKAGVTARFFTGDVTRLDGIPGLNGPFDLVLDIGCLHSLTPEQRIRYAAGLGKWTRPGATFLLYAWGPVTEQNSDPGVSPEQVKELFSPQFQINRIEHGEERTRPSAWYWLEVSAQK